MCQQGQNEIVSCLRAEKEEIHQKWEAFERGEIDLSDDQLEDMAVRMIMIRDRL